MTYAAWRWAATRSVSWNICWRTPRSRAATPCSPPAGPKSNHAMLTAACAARLGLRCVLILKKRGVTDRKGNLVLDDIFGAQVEFMDTDSYEDIYAEMRKRCEVLASQGHKGYIIPVGGSTALGSIGYAECVRELAEQAKEAGIEISHVASATGSGGTTAGLVLGSSIALLFTFVFYRVRSVMTFQDFAACIPEGFKAMVSPMLILSLAWTLSGMTGLLGAKYYVANLLGSSAAALQYLLPFIIFLVAVFLAFATGTSWGTFSILIPIVCQAFPDGEMLVVSIAACLSGAVCGDHCSPISDTTIMASAGAHCSHVNHVSTQLPYAITAAACSAVCYVITGLAQAVLGSRASLVTSLVLLVVAIVLELAVLSVIRARTRAKTSGDAA